MVTLLSMAPLMARAQEADGAPQEAPYVEEDKEFDDFLDTTSTPSGKSIGDEIQDAQKSENQTVDLNANVPEAGSNLPESEVNNESIVAEPAPPTAPVELPRRKASKNGVEYIHHPQAANGLLAITKEGAYIYRTNDTRKYDQTTSVRLASMKPPKIVAADGTTYDTMYASGSQQALAMFDYEWQPLTGYGKLGVQAGFGFMYAKGHGRFVSNDATINGKEAKEEYTFLAVPINLGGVYRLEWMKRQWLAPYVAGGGTYIGVTEFRDDGATPSVVGVPGVYGAAGLLFNVSALDRQTAFVFSSEYGIANLWVSLEYRLLQTFSDDLDFSSGIIGAGISVDY